MTDTPEDGSVRFWIEHDTGIEVATLTAADFRSAMRESDELRLAAREGVSLRAQAIELRRQNDELRAENESLKHDHALFNAQAQTIRGLRAEVEQLRADLRASLADSYSESNALARLRSENDTLRAEHERLWAAIEKITAEVQDGTLSAKQIVANIGWHLGHIARETLGRA